MPETLPATIDEVIERLDKIIQRTKAEKSRIGYFAALYLRVTNTIKDKIGTGYFEDDKRLEKLDCIFAGHYLSALDAYENNSPDLLQSWKLAFDATANGDLTIVEHLLLAMNPHINIDLGNACAEVAPGDDIHGLKNDFLKVNDILGSLVPQVLKELNILSPMIDLVDDIGEKPLIKILDFSMVVARDFAWSLALELAPLSAAEKTPVIAKRDTNVTKVGDKILHPGPVSAAVMELLKQFESDNVVDIIETLNFGNDNTPPVNPNSPNRNYYFNIAAGTWAGTFNFKLKSWAKLWASEIGFKNKVLVTMMTLWQKILSDSKISSRITTFNDEGDNGVARNEFRIYKGFFTVFHSTESYILNADGFGVLVDAHVRFGPIPILFNEHDEYKAVIYEDGYKARYFIKLLGGHFIGDYTVREDGDQIHSLLHNDWAECDEVLDRQKKDDANPSLSFLDS